MLFAGADRDRERRARVPWKVEVRREDEILAAVANAAPFNGGVGTPRRDRREWSVSVRRRGDRPVLDRHGLTSRYPVVELSGQRGPAKREEPSVVRGHAGEEGVAGGDADLGEDRIRVDCDALWDPSVLAPHRRHTRDVDEEVCLREYICSGLCVQAEMTAGRDVAEHPAIPEPDLGHLPREKPGTGVAARVV